PLMMVMGGLLGLTDLPLPAVEVGIAGSAVVLGLLVALAVRVPTALAVAIVAAGSGRSVSPRSPPITIINGKATGSA
ncbi:MAG: HupE/UreJ family protein, partial [Pseudomonadota bacterium]